MADTNSSAKTPQQGASPSLSQRVAGFFRAPGRQGAPGQPRRTSSTSRFIVGSITFVLVAELLTYLIDIANIKFKLNLNQPIIGSSASWLTWFFLINVALILGLWIALNKMGFFPRDMWANSRASNARGSTTSGNGASNGNNKNANQIPGIGKARTRAERRYTATANAMQAANAKKRTAATPDTRATATTADSYGDHDEAYERAKAAQRLRKRRALR